MDPRRRGSRTAAGLKRTGWRVPTAALERRNQHAHRRWHVRRRRFLGGGAFAQARRARGHRRIYEQLGGRGRKRRLHLGARLGRRARRLRPHRHSLLFGQFRQGVLRARVHALSRRIPPRPHAQPGRAVQPRDQVFRLSALCRGIGRGQAGHRPLRPHRRGKRRIHASARRRRKQGSDLFPLPDRPGGALHGHVPRGRADQAGDSRHRPRGGAARVGKEGFHRRVLHRRAQFQEVPLRLPARAAGQRWSRPRAR